MSDNSAIEWTDATWNPVRGCSRVSEGCRNCYAEIMSARFSGPGLWGEGFAHFVGGDHRWTGKVELIESQLELPLQWRGSWRIFVNSTSDLFHEALDSWQIAQVFAVMAVAQQHTFQVLTKRADRMRDRLSSEQFWDEVNAFGTELALESADPLNRRSDDYRAIATDGSVDEPLPNVWLGVSVEDQAAADERIPLLLATPAAVRFLSCEPLLGPIDLFNIRHGSDNDLPVLGTQWGPDWVIVGGESGPGARPMHPDWARSLRDQCAATGVPFFFKQWGIWHPNDHAIKGDTGHTKMNKKLAGRLLDGREHNEFPG